MTDEEIMYKIGAKYPLEEDMKDVKPVELGTGNLKAWDMYT